MEKIRWTTSSLLHLTAGCSIPLATWVMLGRPVDPMTLIAAGCFFFGPALYGTSTPTPRTWREMEFDLTEQQPLFMGMGILAIALGAFLTLVAYARATVVAPSGYPVVAGTRGPGIKRGRPRACRSGTRAVPVIPLETAAQEPNPRRLNAFPGRHIAPS